MRRITQRTAAGSGRTVEDPMTGQRLTFLVTEEESGGEFVRVETGLPPRSPGPPMHYHLSYAERFEVVEGTLDMCVGSEKNHVVLAAGQSALAPARVRTASGTRPTSPWSSWPRSGPREPGRGRARRCAGWPGQAQRRGHPEEPLRAGLDLRAFRQLPHRDAAVLARAIFGTLARIARWRGHDPAFSRYTKA